MSYSTKPRSLGGASAHTPYETTPTCVANMPCEIYPSDAQLWANVYSMEITSGECLAKIRSLLSCRSGIDDARNFQGEEARAFIDFLDQVLVRSPLDDKLRQRSSLLLSKICKAHGIIPTSCIIQRGLIRPGRVRYHGGSADVSDGEYLGSPVAIKRLKMSEADSDRIFKRLCREIIGWKYLSHPNILQLLGVSESVNPRRFRILTEWMPNGNVMDYAKSHPEANRLRLLSEVMSGVAYFHGLRVVHGDLKGANILVDNAGTARVADFGLMVMADLGTVLLSETAVSPQGTLPWMSPELLDSPPDSDGRPTRESDCYALGMVIYEVLTGLRPFHHLDGYYKIVSAIVRGRRPEKPFEAESLGLSDALWGLLQSCWSESSSIRPTAQQLLDYLSPASLTWVPPPIYPAIESDVTDSDSSGSLGDPITGPVSEW